MQQCKGLAQDYEPLIREELHWWKETGITSELLERSKDAQVHTRLMSGRPCCSYQICECRESTACCQCKQKPTSKLCQ